MSMRRQTNDFNPNFSTGDMAASGPALDWRKAADIVVEALAATDATPGGGAAAGISASMGCGLAAMAVGISLKSKKLDPAKKPELETALELLGVLREDFKRLTREDAAVFGAFMAAMGLPKSDPERPARMQAALIHAAKVPLSTAKTAAEAHRHVLQVLPITGDAVASDMNCAVHLLKAAALCAAENVRINLGGIKDAAEVKRLESKIAAALKSIG